jgi:hypothetical protein
MHESQIRAPDTRTVRQTISPYPPTPTGFAARVARAIGPQWRPREND